MSNFSKAALFVGMIVAIVLTTWVYYPAMHGPFLFDDFPNIVSNSRVLLTELDVNSLISAAFSSSAGPSGRPISMISFGLNYYFFGLSPFSFKLTNLVLHLISGVLVFLFCWRLQCAMIRLNAVAHAPKSIEWVSLVVAVAWLLHPFNVSTVAYVVQRMTILANLFMLLGLVHYLELRIRFATKVHTKRQFAILFCVLAGWTFLGVLAKENAIILPLLAFVIEFTLLQFKTASSTQTTSLQRLLPRLVVALFVIAAIFLFLFPDFVLRAYLNRDFTLVERVMSQARILFFYLYQIALPDISQMGLFHDDISISRSLFNPVQTLPAVLAWLGIFILALTRKFRVFSFAVLFYLTSHLIESSILGLEMVFEHRNYLAMVGPLFLGVYFIFNVKLHSPRTLLRAFAASLCIIMLALVTQQRSLYWENELIFAQSAVRHHPESARNAFELGKVLYNIPALTDDEKQRRWETVRTQFVQALTLNPSSVNAAISLFIIDSEMGKQLDKEIWQRFLQGLTSRPLPNNLPDSIISLIKCQTEKRCHFEHAVWQEMFAALDKNPRQNADMRASLLNALSTYQVNLLQDLPAAIQSLQSATRLAPQDLSLRHTLIQLLIVSARIPEAQIQLQILISHDKLHVWKNQIHELQEEMQHAQTKQI